MTSNTFQALRQRQLEKTLAAYEPARNVPRPQKGWLSAVRQALGLSASDVAQRLGVTRSLPLQLEKAEANDSITLKSLRNAAAAMGCDLVYALVPRSGTLQQTAEEAASAELREHALRVEHSMALENQSVGSVDETVAAELALRKKGSRAT